MLTRATRPGAESDRVWLASRRLASVSWLP